jgi:hypothetical protein
MGKLLSGKFELDIIGLRTPNNPQSENPDEYTARYLARVVKTEAEGVKPGDIVSVKMWHYGNAEAYKGRNIFDGDVNDIQDDPSQDIDTSRGTRQPETFINPFGPLPKKS